jgi:hypothetical protein
MAMWARPAKRTTLARPGTAIVIEGFSRSGNTFSAAAFAVANGNAAHVGRHLHGAPHLLRAARLELPAVALVRPPRDAVVSYLIRRSALTPSDALLEYADFYRTAWRARDSFVVGLFDVVVSDFGAVIDMVNARFGTAFKRYEPTAQNEAAAFALVERMNRLECRGDVVETHVGRPSAERNRRKEQLSGLLDSPRLRPRLQRAEDLYDRYAQLAAAQSRI